MSKKLLQRVVIILAGLVVVYGVVRLATGGGPAPSAGALELAAEFAEIDDRSLESAILSGPEEEIRLAQVAGEGWTVNGFEADSAAVERMFRALDEVEAGSLAAANPDNHERLGVAGREAWMLEFNLRSGESRIVVLGRVGAAFQTAYARLPGSEEVYMLRGDMRGSMTRTVSDWRDKLITRVDRASVQTIETERDGESVALRRADEGWVLAGSGAVPDSASVENILDEIDDLRAIGFPDEGSEFPAEPEDMRRLVALDASGDTLTTLDMASVESEYWVRARGTEVLFRLASFRANRIVPEPGRLMGTDDSN